MTYLRVLARSRREQHQHHQQHQHLVGTLRALCSAIQLQLSALASVSDAVAASDKEFTANRQRLLVSQLRLSFATVPCGNFFVQNMAVLIYHFKVERLSYQQFNGRFHSLPYDHSSAQVGFIHGLHWIRSDFAEYIVG